MSEDETVATAALQAGPEDPSIWHNVVVGVGYGWWNGSVQADPRWRVLREALGGVCQDALKRATKQSSETQDEGEGELSFVVDSDRRPFHLPTAQVRRLRATTGQFVWDSIKRHIDESDVLVFDITPTREDPATGAMSLTDNVWIELGYAYGRGKPVYVVSEEPDAYKRIPSDLQGLMVGHIASNGKIADASLRMSIVQTVVELLTTRHRMRLAEAKKSDNSERELAP